MNETERRKEKWGEGEANDDSLLNILVCTTSCAYEQIGPSHLVTSKCGRTGPMQTHAVTGTLSLHFMAPGLVCLIKLIQKLTANELFRQSERGIEEKQQTQPHLFSGESDHARHLVDSFNTQATHTTRA